MIWLLLACGSGDGFFEPEGRSEMFPVASPWILGRPGELKAALEARGLTVAEVKPLPSGFSLWVSRRTVEVEVGVEAFGGSDPHVGVELKSRARGSAFDAMVTEVRAGFRAIDVEPQPFTKR